MLERIQELKRKLYLNDHPEGGFYSETYRSSEVIPHEALSQEFGGDRNVATGIYFLLTSDTFSAFHRIKQDEMWHYYEGSSITIHMIDKNGMYSFQRLGLDFMLNEIPQFTVPKNVWFAAEVNAPDSYCLVGCNVFPGFDFEDFELARESTLSESFPSHVEVIQKFTRG